jgi:outer membrane protein OmpA-like peptidoglycan-associated protein
VSSTGWNASSLLGLFGEQRSFLTDAPEGLASIVSAGNVGIPIGGRFIRVPAEIADDIPEAPRRGRRWLWVIPILLLIPALLFFLGRDRQPRTDTAATTAPALDATPATPEVPSAVATGGSAALGPLVERPLPNNAQLRIPANGLESKLLAFIQDPGQAADNETWFSFDRLDFATDSARLSPTASEQLGNIAEILRAYPNVKVKIGGYTDNTADPAHNLELSRARASATKDAIAALGIDQSRLSAEGYGDAHPVADNGTAEGRQRNRRVDIRVTEK